MEQRINKTTRRLRLHSLTLNKNDIRELCKVVVKAASDPESSVVRLIVSGNREAISTDSIDKLISAGWPEEINEVSLEAFDNKNFVRMLTSAHSMGANEVVISSLDSEWVTTRVKEIEDFVSEHKNQHWIFFDGPLLALTSLALGAMIGAGMALGLDLSFEYGVLAGGLGLGVSVSIMGQLHKVYPYILVEGGRSSAKSKLRKFIHGAILTLVGGIIFNLIWQVVDQLVAR